jgi:hypothetical protein
VFCDWRGRKKDAGFDPDSAFATTAGRKCRGTELGTESLSFGTESCRNMDVVWLASQKQKSRKPLRIHGF